MAKADKKLQNDLDIVHTLRSLKKLKEFKKVMLPRPQRKLLFLSKNFVIDIDKENKKKKITDYLRVITSMNNTFFNSADKHDYTSMELSKMILGPDDFRFLMRSKDW